MKRRSRFQSKGTATVELAVCLPVLAAVVFGTLEACTMLYVYQSLEITAYEAVRMSIRSDAYQREPGQPNVMTNAQVLAHAEEMLAERGVVNGEVEISAADVADVAPGEMVTITVTAPSGDNSMLPAWFWDANATLTATATMVKE